MYLKLTNLELTPRQKTIQLVLSRFSSTAQKHLKDSTLLTERTRLYQAASKGDWNSIEGMPHIQRCLGIKGETTLHIAAAAEREQFVNKLLKWMRDNNRLTAENVSLTARNEIGATALHFAAAVGNVEIAKAMLLRDTNGDLPNIATTGENPMKPILMAASLGHDKMVGLLYPKTTMVGNEETEIFITCIKNNLYGEALQMLKANRNLARDESNGETALHVLASKPSAFVNESQPGVLRRHINIPWLKFKQENSKQSVANDLFTECLMAYKGDVEDLIETPEIPQALFDAARVGNVEFIIKLISFDFDILWTTDNNKSVFHIAVEERHESIFNLLHELGSVGKIIVERRFENRSNILHLAARLAPQEKLNAISGAALQMQREFLWFKEVEKVVSPEYREMKNNEGDTPYVLFAKNHEELRRGGEKLLTNTAKSSMLVATLIGSIMFPGQVADGLNKNPHIYLAFSVSTAISFFGSSMSLIMFLSILTSRYSYEDFLVSLPARLMIGVTSLYISIFAMMVAFSTSFWLKNYNHWGAIFVVIGLCACVPISDVLLKYHLVFDMVQSTFFRFRPQHRLLYEEVSNTPVPRSQSDAPANPTGV